MVLNTHHTDRLPRNLEFLKIDFGGGFVKRKVSDSIQDLIIIGVSRPVGTKPAASYSDTNFFSALSLSWALKSSFNSLGFFCRDIEAELG